MPNTNHYPAIDITADSLNDALHLLPEGAAVSVFTDGAAEPSNPGPAGSAFVIVHEGTEIATWSEHIGFTTNNIAELTPAIRALELLSERTDLTISIFSDSQYLVNGMNQWLRTWKATGWRNAARKPVKNRELWERLDELANRFPTLEWRWIKGHIGHRWNERADGLANAATWKTTKAAVA
ncbi:ribonuclease H family protein [Pleomorphomonas carboxyditropha]|uniref:Ribonuclease H n=1 Tax=Pleomorphomonas carboxyditropha TaxID=2023338 RepID=A0A2G9WU86_9HYPH|nr:ribonuclease H [Pleomorphomonas carboxyditropha]PIO98277.1 hypothetical protein CJ014_16625 [Pleomorphomonas carboxyditropha]